MESMAVYCYTDKGGATIKKEDNYREKVSEWG